MKSNVKIGRLAGIDIELHYTWFIIITLLALGLASGFFPEYYPGLTTTEYWIIGIISAILLFASVLAHELMHSLVAKKYKLGVEKITLFFFGGIAQIESEDITPKKEFLMAAAGPAFSLVLAGVFFLLWKSTSIIYVQAVSFYLALLNLILGVFNLAPRFPLDGGRMFRAALWHFTKNLKKATKIAAFAGKIFAGFLMILGFAGFFGVGIEIFGVVLGGFWFLIIGIFLYFLAGMSYEQIILKETLSKVKIRQVMAKEFISVNETVNIADLFNKYFIKYGRDSFVVLKDKKLTGIVNTDCLKGIPKKSWLKVKVKDVMVPVDKIFKANPNQTAYSVLLSISKQKSNLVPVIDKSKLVGIIDVTTLIRYTRLKTQIE